MDEGFMTSAGQPAENTDNAVQEGVVAPEEMDLQNESKTPEPEKKEPENQQPQPPANANTGRPKQNRAENRQMKELRRKAEQYDNTAKEIIDLARAKGLHPTDAPEAVEMLAAAEKGKTLEEYRRDRSAAAEEEERRVKESPLYKALEEQVAKNADDLMAFRIEQEMKKDLAEIQAVDPSVKSLDDLGAEYQEMVKAGITGINAFYAIRGKQAIQNAAIPPTTGVVGGKTDTERDFTGEELDRLTEKDLDDQNLLERAIRSLHKLK